jgi:hypothetical protein
MPALVTIGFAPPWAIGLCLMTVLFSLVFMYAEVLSPKYVQNTGSVTQAGKTSEPTTTPIAPVVDAATKVKVRPLTDNTKMAATDVPSIVKTWIDFGQDTTTGILSAQSEIREAIRM